MKAIDLRKALIQLYSKNDWQPVKAEVVNETIANMTLTGNSKHGYVKGRIIAGYSFYVPSDKLKKLAGVEPFNG